jgi:UDP-N-acetylmuramate dehydrogenase
VNIQKQVSLKKYNTFGINVFCDYFIEINNADELSRIIFDESFKNIQKLIIGGGSNILFTENFHGLIIKNSIKGILIEKEDHEAVLIKAYAGEVWNDVVMFAINKNLGGIENLSLIPGQVGAAPMQNIGAYGIELDTVFHSLEAMDLQTGEIKIFYKEDCKFGYRESIFKKEAKGKYCILSVNMKLSKKHILNTKYGAINETLKSMDVHQPTIQNISEAVIKIRSSKLPDPKQLGNAGSFFKNPEIERNLFEKLKSNYPEIPNYPLPDNKIKIPAAWLIEQCGWKGKRIGDAGSHINQPLVLVNYGNATGRDIKNLSEKIQISVQEKFGIVLTPEVNII